MSNKRSTHLISAHLRRFDEDEGGAILLACLAGCLIVFMVSLTMYDAGNITREKIKLQTATDTAAYSQAAVKARTMNANAYVNITKRSIVGIHLTYFTAHNYFYTDMWTRLSQCIIDPTQPICTILYETIPCRSADAKSQSSNKCHSGDRCCNIFVTTREHQVDFSFNNASFSNDASLGGDVYPEAPIDLCIVDANPSDPTTDPACTPASAINGSSNPATGIFIASTFSGASNLEAAQLHGATDKYTKELRQLTRYQEYMQVITPWWAFSEALARATHNGATMATTYPAPAGLQTASLTGNYPSGSTPTGVMDDDWSWPAANVLSGTGNAGLAAQFSAFNSHICSEFVGGSDPSAPFRDPLFNEEMGIHVNSLQRNSDGAVNTSGNPYASQVFAQDSLSGAFKTIGGYTMCFMLHLGRHSSRVTGTGGKSTSWYDKNTVQTGQAAVPIFDTAYSSPYLVSVDPKTSELARMRLSNIVFGYYQGSDFRRNQTGTDNGMTRFEYMTQDYESTLPVEARGTGIWTMARGEIVTLGNSDGNWHASWTARVRPIARPNEFNAVESEMGIPNNSFLSNAFRTAIPYMGLNEKIGHADGTTDHHPEVWQDETNTMDRAMKTMDSASSPGMFK